MRNNNVYSDLLLIKMIFLYLCPEIIIIGMQYFYDNSFVIKIRDGFIRKWFKSGRYRLPRSFCSFVLSFHYRDCISIKYFSLVARTHYPVVSLPLSELHAFVKLLKSTGENAGSVSPQISVAPPPRERRGWSIVSPREYILSRKIVAAVFLKVLLAGHEVLS